MLYTTAKCQITSFVLFNIHMRCWNVHQFLFQLQLPKHLAHKLKKQLDSLRKENGFLNYTVSNPIGNKPSPIWNQLGHDQALDKYKYAIGSSSSNDQSSIFSPKHYLVPQLKKKTVLLNQSLRSLAFIAVCQKQLLKGLVYIFSIV